MMSARPRPNPTKVALSLSVSLGAEPELSRQSCSISDDKWRCRAAALLGTRQNMHKLSKPSPSTRTRARVTPNYVVASPESLMLIASLPFARPLMPLS